jgi:oligopeptide/dipeptide ABC transporter ATP-binding protein
MEEGAGEGLPQLHRMTPLLEVADLAVAYTSRTGGEVAAIAGASFEVRAGETLGVLGESGSGKSTLAAALLRLLPENGKIQKGVVLFEGQDLLQAEPRELEKIRGGRVALIFQEPALALHPMLRVGQQVQDVLAAHRTLPRRALRERTLELLSSVFPADAERISSSYSHQLSGGQRQRVLIAQAIACEPALIIADEPTASLDPTTEQEILSLFRTLQQKFRLAMILITHKPAVLAGLADRVLVLYAGRVVEIGPTETVLGSPHHPYTQALLGCLPPPIESYANCSKTNLPVIAGDSANLALLASGCQFEPRCAERMNICIKSEPATVGLSNTHVVACFKYGG